MPIQEPDRCTKGGEHDVTTDIENREDGYWFRVRCNKCDFVFDDWHNYRAEFEEPDDA